jgi:hypothetical protein
MVSVATREPHPLVRSRPKSDGSKGRFDGVGGAQVRPAFGREWIKAEERVLVFLQALAAFGVLQLVMGQEALVSFEGVLPPGRQVEVVEQLLSAALQTLGQFIQHVGRFMHESNVVVPRRGQTPPAALTRSRVNRRRGPVGAPHVGRGL